MPNSGKDKAAHFEFPLKDVHYQRAFDAEEADPDPETRDEDDSVGEVGRLVRTFSNSLNMSTECND